MTDFGQELSDFIDSMIDHGPQKTGLMKYFKGHYRQIMIMKDSGYTSKQITDFLNTQVAAGKIIELSKAVSVVYFNKAWREFCIKKNIPTKPTATIMQQIENEIFEYRDILAKPKSAIAENTPKLPPASQETALQLAELIKFLLELLKQNTGKNDQKPSEGLQSAAMDVADAIKEQNQVPQKAVGPASADIKSLDKTRIASFFSDE